MTAIAENGTDRAPDGWDIVELGQIADLLNGYAFKSEDYAPSGILNFRVVNIRDQGLINATTDIEFLPLEFTHSHQQYLLSEGDILVVMVGATRGKIGYIPAGILPALMNQNMWRIVPKVKDDVDRRYLYYFLTLVVPKFVHEYSESARGFFKKSDFRSIKVPKPKFKEQQTIARVLDVVQRAIEQQERLIVLTTELKKALLHKLFTEGLRGEPQKQTEIGPVPESWEVVLLEDCAVVQTGVAKGRKLDGKDSLTLPYLRVANVQSGFLDLREMKTITIQTKERARYLLQNSDVVLTEGGDFDKLGRGFIWKGEIDDCVHQNHIFAVRVDRSRLLPEFFAHLSQSPYGKKYFLSVAHKTTNLACINTTKLKGFPVLIPSVEEQCEIVSILETVDAQLSVHERKRRSLSDLFRTLLHQLMTAQIRVNDLDLDEILQQPVTEIGAKRLIRRL